MDPTGTGENGSGDSAAGSPLAVHASGEPLEDSHQSAQEKRAEQHKIRRLQMMMDMVMSVIHQDSRLTVDQAAELVAGSKKAALAMFPDKELAFDLIYKPRLQRVMCERFRIQ